MTKQKIDQYRRRVRELNRKLDKFDNGKLVDEPGDFGRLARLIRDVDEYNISEKGKAGNYKGKKLAVHWKCNKSGIALGNTVVELKRWLTMAEKEYAEAGAMLARGAREDKNHDG